MVAADSISGSIRPEELPELSEFLTRGFHLSADAESMSAKVLSWKYLTPLSFAQGTRECVARNNGKIIGHVGFCPRAFTVRKERCDEIATTHPIDWYAAPGYPFLGYQLIVRGCRPLPTVYSVGGSALAQKAMELMNFEVRCEIEIYRKILRPIRRRFAIAGPSWLRKSLAAAHDSVRGRRRTGIRPQRPVEVRRVQTFGREVDDVLSRWSGPLVYSTRRPELLNYYLAHPTGQFSGWTIHEGQDTVGFALLNTVRVVGPKEGRIVECFLVRPDESLWQAALFALVEALRQFDPDEVTCFASTPWMTQALKKNAFGPIGCTRMFLRDEENLVPRDCPYHLTQLEADLAFI